MSFEKEIGEAAFKEKPDIAQVFIRQLDRTNQAAIIDPGSHQTSIFQILSTLPAQWREWVYAQEDKYTNYEPRWIFKTYQGYEIGTKEDPRLIDESKPIRRLSDNSIDWEDPNIYSPKLDTNPPPIDYRAFNELVMEAAERAGLSWNIKPHTYDNGDVTDEMKKNKKKQPLHPIKKTRSGKKYSDTPPGSNMNAISTIPGTRLQIVDWHGTQVVQGIGFSPIFFNLIQERTNKENGTIIGMGGGPGEGKTWFGMRLGEILNRVKTGRSFNPYVQMPFTQEHFLWLLSADTPLKLGDVIVLDEAHFAAGARNWFKEDQKELVDLIATARNNGFIIILIVLHIDMLDKILRQFTMAFYVHLESPGHATAYKTFTPRFNNEMIKNTIGPVTLQVPGIGSCDHPRCLHCKHLNPDTPDITPCPVNRAIYERRKRHFQSMKVEASLQRRQDIKDTKTKDGELLELLHNFHDELKLTTQGNIDNTQIQFIIARERKKEVGKTKSRELAKKYVLQYPGAVYNTNS